MKVHMKQCGSREQSVQRESGTGIGYSEAAQVLLLSPDKLQASGLPIISEAGRLALPARRSPVQQAVRRLQARHATAGDALKAAFTKQRQRQRRAAVVRQLRQDG